MLKKMDDKAQGSMMKYLLIMLIMMFVFTSTNIGIYLGQIFGLALQPIIGFNGQYPVLTIFMAGIIVVILSGSLTNFFTDWKKMGEMQQTQKAFSAEMQKARKEGNTNRVNRLMKMQPELMRKQQEASSGSMKSMLFLFIFIWPIFIWLRGFLAGLDHFYFTTPWVHSVSLFHRPFLMQAWLWLYLIFSMVIGQVIRQGLKYISWSDWWKNIKSKITPSLPK
jgi:uncharacterized membrane protein (DUF106 family)